MVARILLLALHVAIAIAAKCNTGFSVVAPEVAVPGKTTAILVTLHGRADEALDPLNVTVNLTTQDEYSFVKVLATASQMITNYGIIQLQIPASPATHCTLHTSVGCIGNDNCTARSHSVIKLLGPVRDVIVRPARHHYRPGETITFWIMALDHDLRLVKGEIAYVALIDPADTTVALWDQLSMDEGVRKLSSILAAGARSGTWRIEASCGGGSARVDLTVGAGYGNATPATPAAEQHYVELKFADSMRRRYKPGLPFVGRVEALSTEKRVRVRVKLYDDNTDIYSQDIDMSAGEGGFMVPTVMATAPYVNLQAELVAVEGKEIETHYVLAKERIHRWNSTSKCYLLVENFPTPLEAGGTASASVWSSCGCQQSLLAAITSGGRAVHWAAVPAPPPSKVCIIDCNLCRFNYTFPVTGDMAPASSLLVYYVTETGEPVSDVASFHVRLLHKEVSVSVEERRWWYPRAALQLKVVAPTDSLMCLIGARSPPDTRFDPHQPNLQVHEEHPGPEFVSAGVSLFVGGGECGGGVLYRQQKLPGTKLPPNLVPPASHDRLWMWKCFNYTSHLSTDGVTIAAPSEAGRWSLWALSLSSSGLRFSAPRTINVFRPIQLDFSLPAALKVGETVELDVKINNNINNCMDVTALLALSSGAAFASTGALYVTERLRLGPRGGTQLVVRVAVNTPGRKNITVEVTGYSADNCSVSYTSFNNETLVGSVIRSASVLVLPEGLHRSDTQSAYFCANEHLAVSSRGSWEWHWVAAPRNRAGLVLELRAQGAAHVALSSIQNPSDDMYRVVFERSRVWIAKGKHGYDVHLASAEQTESDDECAGALTWCAWWVWWEGGRLSVGRGAAPSERRLLVWPLTTDVRIKYVGFSSLWGDKADFRIWNFNEEAGFSQVLELGLPHGVVPGSATGTLLVSGGLHLPLYSLHSDSTEQYTDVWKDSQLSAVSASLAPLLALEHIPHLVDDVEKERILKKLPEQVQILLSFRKSDNSFSDHPAVSSHLSTIKILEILNKIQTYYPVDPRLLQSIKFWIQTRQNSDGSFTPLGADKEVDYYPVDIKKDNGSEIKVDVNEYYYYNKGGNMTKEEINWERTVEVTAETLVALLEVGVENQMDADVAKKAQNYLEKNLHNLTSPAALAATVLALVLGRSPVVPEALDILRNASTTEEGEFGWPAPRKDAADWLLEETSRNIKTTSYEAVTMEQYVAGVRVLLAACARGALAAGEAAARFLYYRASTLQRHPSLAYAATKAAAQYAALAHDKHRALTVSLATAGMELTDTLELRAKTPPRPLQLPGLPTKVFVYATGAGCATVQGTISYSTYSPKRENALLNIQSAVIEEIRPERSSIEDLQGNLPTLIIKTCFKWKGKERSGILRLESSLFSGYELHTVNPVVLDGATFADLHYGSRGESAWFVFVNISSTCPVCVTYEARSKFVITSLRPAFSKIYPSTRPDLAVETFFHARPGSPLLKGITDDDFITWFDKTETSNIKSSVNIDNVCECGRICSRDYEFRKDYESKYGNVSTITTSSSLEPQTITESSNKYKQTRSFIHTTTKGTLKTTKNKPINTLAIGAINKKNVQFLSSPIDISTTLNRSVELITLPTKTKTYEKDILNNNVQILQPQVNTELRSQKDIIIKYPDIKKKNLPRRKGTLKATYGDKHENFFLKARVSEPILISNFNTNNTKNGKIIVEDLQQINKNDSYFDTNPEKNVTFLLNNKTNNKEVLNKKNVNNTVIVIPNRSKQISVTSSRSIVAITNSNIETVYHVTKRPKPITQIDKPRIHLISSEDHKNLKDKDFIEASKDTVNISKSAFREILNISVTTTPPITYNNSNTKSDGISSLLNETSSIETDESTVKKSNSINKEIRKTAQLPILDTIKHYTSNARSNRPIQVNNTPIETSKRNVKVSKSLNKDIRNTPETPISETTKYLSRNYKFDIAPTNKSFEMLDKNKIWALLKESSDTDIHEYESAYQAYANHLNMLKNSTRKDEHSL